MVIEIFRMITRLNTKREEGKLKEKETTMVGVKEGASESKKRHFVL